MMLTDKELNALCRQGEENNWDDGQFARAIIAANNAKALADLKPVQARVAVKMYGYSILAEIAAKEDLYAAETVSALTQERDALAAKVKALEIRVEDGLPL